MGAMPLVIHRVVGIVCEIPSVKGEVGMFPHITGQVVVVIVYACIKHGNYHIPASIAKCPNLGGIYIQKVPGDFPSAWRCFFFKIFFFVRINQYPFFININALNIIAGGELFNGFAGRITI